MRGQTSRWIAPFERMERADNGANVAASGGIRGRLTGFVDSEGADMLGLARPVRDFRGWAWQAAPCVDGSVGAATTDCRKGDFLFRSVCRSKYFVKRCFVNRAPRSRQRTSTRLCCVSRCSRRGRQQRPDF